MISFHREKKERSAAGSRRKGRTAITTRQYVKIRRKQGPGERRERAAVTQVYGAVAALSKVAHRLSVRHRKAVMGRALLRD